jgi:AAA domain-containing protein
MATTSNLPPLSHEAAKGLFDQKEKDDVDPFEEVEANGSIRYFKTVFFGEPGSGKTRLASLMSLPDEKMYWIDCEDSKRVLVGHPDLKGRLKVGKFYGLIEAAYTIEKIIREGIYKTVVLDSFTSARRLEMLDILKNSGFSRSKTPGGQQSFTEQDYGLFLNRLEWFLDYVIRAPLNVIINAHVKEPTDTQIINGQKKRPIGSDNQIASLGSTMGNVFFVEEVVNDKGDRARVVRMRTDGKIQVKCTIDEMPDIMRADKFVAAIHNWRQGKPIS